ncbi:MAG: peroxiredoxin [Candidatus Acetothermia bacterium]|jgi:peroxiredoxin|nr:peroxiredoxin [Candidatus Acetothermia bacterium]MDH7504530.1 peroxiredoxin [Candidatus Acetothermia bacterium]
MAGEVELMIDVGAAAPDFTLKDQRGSELRLRALRGKRVVLGFHPLAWTKVCAEQMLDLERHKAEFDRLGAVALGISVDSVPSKRAWAEALGIEETPLLADFWPHGEVARKFGVFREEDGFSERAVFILDEAGIVRFAKVYPIRELPPIEELLEALEGLSRR